MLKKKPQRVEILTIGDELLDGRVVDTNTVRLAQALGALGSHIQQRTSIIDDVAAIIREAQAIAGRKTDLCIVSGGLGPTSDDLTAEAFAKLLGVGLRRDAAQAEAIEARLKARGRQVTPNQLKQADRPEGADVITNALGTAPGFAVTYAGCLFVAVPGVPKEFDHLIERYVLAPLQKDAVPVLRRGLYLFDIIEAEADHRLRYMRDEFASVRLQFRVKLPEIHVTMHAPQSDIARLDAAHQKARDKLGIHVFAEDETPFAAVVLALMQDKKSTLAVAESCTGGLITDMLTDVPGSSESVHVGVTAYANDAKKNLLGVKDSTLAQVGAVSEQSVIEMANGVRQLCGSTFGLAASGIAGPGGSTNHKPVGTLWLALAHPKGVYTRTLVLPFDRRGNKQVGAYLGLDMLRRHLLGAPQA